MEQSSDWLVELDQAAIDEIRVAVDQVEKSEISMLDMTAADFALPTLGRRMVSLAGELDRGRGFWVIRGLPMDELTERQAALVFWGLGLHMGVPVSQNARGHLLGHVTDEGRDFRTDPGVRGYQTRLRLPYHTDSSDVVGLLCLKPAQRGGLSSVASTTSAYNELLRRRPDLAHLWFKPWCFDRRNEELPGQAPYFHTPLATWNDGLLSVRYVRGFLDSAQRHDGVPPRTSDEREFLDLIDEISEEPGFALNIDFRPGDIEFVCNYSTFHSRTEYDDPDDPTEKRHLLRLWLTLHEGRTIPDDFGRGLQDGSAGRGGIAPVPGIAETLAGTYA